MFLVLAAVVSLTAFQDSTTVAGVEVQRERVMTEEERREAEREARLNEVICRREHVVGSNRPQRICQTRREWDHLRDQAQEALRDGGLRQGDPSTVQQGAG